MDDVAAQPLPTGTGVSVERSVTETPLSAIATTKPAKMPRMRIRHVIAAVAITAAALAACTINDHSENNSQPKATASDPTRR